MSSESTHHPFIYPDPELPGQKYICISFLKPQMESLVEEKQKFIYEKFLRNYLNQLDPLIKFRLNNPNVQMTEHMKELLNPTDLELKGRVETFYETHKTELDNEFNELFNQKNYTTERALKVRGCFQTMEEASNHAKKLSDREGQLLNIYVATMGAWLLFDPVNVQSVEYQDETLDALLNSQDQEKIRSEMEFEERRHRMMDSIKKENVKTQKKNLKYLKKTKPKKLTKETESKYYPLYTKKELTDFYKKLGLEMNKKMSKSELIESIDFYLHSSVINETPTEIQEKMEDYNKLFSSFGEGGGKRLVTKKNVDGTEKKVEMEEEKKE